jgi:DNA-binding NarL/FixJ family response regulator
MRHTNVSSQDAGISSVLKDAEEWIAGSRGRARQLRRALEECRIPILTVDNERRYTEANSATRLLFRMTLTELRAAQIEDLTAPEYKTVLQYDWSRLMADGQACGPFEIGFFDGSRLRIVYRALANVLPGQHVIAFAPSEWPGDELAAWHDPDPRAIAGPLTGREREVLTLIAGGARIEQIATELTISPATVKAHIRNIHRKLGTLNRAHAVAVAGRMGLIDLSLAGLLGS